MLLVKFCEHDNLEIEVNNGSWSADAGVDGKGNKFKKGQRDKEMLYMHHSQFVKILIFVPVLMIDCIYSQLSVEGNLPNNTFLSPKHECSLD